MARKQARKYISFNLDKSPVIEENERLLSTPTTPQQTQTTEVVESAETAEPIAQQEVQIQPQSQQQPEPQQQALPQVQPEPQVQTQPEPQPQVQQQPITQPISSMPTVGNRLKRTEQGITVIVPMEYYEQIALMKMRTGIPIRDIALQAVIEFVDKHKND